MGRLLLRILFLAGVVNLVTVGFVYGQDATRGPSALSAVAAPDLSNAIQNSFDSTLNVPAPNENQARQNNQAKVDRPFYSNSFPPMIVKVRTVNWDE
jgi:hypothetical protein